MSFFKFYCTFICFVAVLNIGFSQGPASNDTSTQPTDTSAPSTNTSAPSTNTSTQQPSGTSTPPLDTSAPSNNTSAPSTNTTTSSNDTSSAPTPGPFIQMMENLLQRIISPPASDNSTTPSPSGST